MNDVQQQFEQGLATIRVLTGVSRADFDLLRAAAPHARLWQDEAPQVFYDALFNHARTAAVFLPGERPMREQTLREWYLALLDVEDEAQFWHKQARIALAHIRRHINNEFMIGITLPMQNWFTAKALTVFEPQQAVAIGLAFGRVLNAVTGLTAEGYDVFSALAFQESTGASPHLIARLIEESVDDVQRAALSK